MGIRRVSIRRGDSRKYDARRRRLALSASVQYGFPAVFLAFLPLQPVLRLGKNGNVSEMRMPTKAIESHRREDEEMKKQLPNEKKDEKVCVDLKAFADRKKAQPAQEPAADPKCEGGVCALNWKPNRQAAA